MNLPGVPLEYVLIWTKIQQKLLKHPTPPHISSMKANKAVRFMLGLRTQFHISAIIIISLFFRLLCFVCISALAGIWHSSEVGSWKKGCARRSQGAAQKPWRTCFTRACIILLIENTHTQTLNAFTYCSVSIMKGLGWQRHINFQWARRAIKVWFFSAC